MRGNFKRDKDMTSFEIYVLIFADKLHEASIAISTFGGVTLAITIILYAINKSVEDEDWSPVTKKYFSRYAIAIGIFGIIYVFSPTTKELAAIVFIPKFYNAITENKQLAELPSNIAELANEWISELKPSNRGVK
jgi:hypothetical protein